MIGPAVLFVALVCCVAFLMVTLQVLRMVVSMGLLVRAIVKLRVDKTSFL